MTCYFRHLGVVFAKAGIVVTPENRKQLDRIIHDIVYVNYKDCPDTWYAVKKRLAEDEAGFIQELKTAWSSQKSA